MSQATSHYRRAIDAIEVAGYLVDSLPDGVGHDLAETIAGVIGDVRTLADENEIDVKKTWAEMFPEGRDIFYEGDDPDGFVAEIIAEFGFDPRNCPARYLGFNRAEGPTWTAERGWAFRCPAEHLDAIYSARFPMGS
jgi:hypothetical protein